MYRQPTLRLVSLAGTAGLLLVLSTIGYDFGVARAQTSTPAITIRRAVTVPSQPAAKLSNPQAGELPDQVFATSEPGTASTEAQPESRLSKIQKLTFDRRPSTILNAWSGRDEIKSAKSATARTTTSTSVSANAALQAALLARTEAMARATPGTVVATTSAATKSDSPAKPDPFDEELAKFQRSVTLGQWKEVQAFLGKLPEDEARALYSRLIQALPNPSSSGSSVTAMDIPMARPMIGGQFAEKPALSTADVFALAVAAPHPKEPTKEAAKPTKETTQSSTPVATSEKSPLEESLDGLGNLLRMALDQGHELGDFVRRVKASTNPPVLTARQTAKLLMASNSAIEAGQFLPEIARAEADKDREALNLLSRHYLAVHAKEQKVADLERAWSVTQAVLSLAESSSELEREQKDEALRRAVDLAPKVSKSLGEQWLKESFAGRPERGRELLAAIGGPAAQGMQTRPMDPDGRLKQLELQKTAAESLLNTPAAASKIAEWREALTRLASAWLVEAEFSRDNDPSTSLGPRMQRDLYGNLFFLQQQEEEQQRMMMMGQQRDRPRPLKVADLLKARPSAAWLQSIDPTLSPRFSTVFAQLFLKVGEERDAFPFIEKLAADHPDQAQELINEFLRVWTRNHDPNEQRSRTNPYMFMYGFERRAEGIPLTRSKQERNLKDLAGWIERLKQLKLGKIDETLLTRAFTTCHSSAEVYRQEAIEAIFGRLEELKPETLAALIQQMRTNLVSVWRQPAVQEKAQTKRKERDIRVEVQRGYQVALSVVDNGLKKHPGHWALLLARAAVLHDQNNYVRELEPSTDYLPARRMAMAIFREAADAYARVASGLPEEEQTTQAFDQWFYASLGACDLSAIDDKVQPDLTQTPLITKAIRDLPGEAAKRHLDRFANTLFTRMSGLNPAVKFRYLREGFQIVGDHEQAKEARKVYDYYKDLVSEIKLEAVPDGPDEVGHGVPFGLFVNLRHTREIERESGGFARYLQNQKNNTSFYYNYGRPLENYRDKFEEAARQALSEQFEVVSVTFQDEKVNSKAAREYGWRVTPYAYLLLKAKDAKVDRIPPVKLDLDFLDTTGYVVLPVESPAVPIDASVAPKAARPFVNLAVAQTLDERQASDGRLILEIKATASGLVPELDQLLKVESPGFLIEKTDDQGLSITQFDPESAETRVISERNWTLTLRGQSDLAQRPRQFRFASLLVENGKPTYQRYVDADLASVESVVDLEAGYGQERGPWRWLPWVVGGIALVGAIVVLIRRGRRGPAVSVGDRFVVPDPVTPFTVLGLLRSIESHKGQTSAFQAELAQAIGQVERSYFARSDGPPPDLQAIAETWARRASTTTSASISSTAQTPAA